MKAKLQKILAVTALTGLLTSSALAVVVPAGTELDPNQIIRFVNSDEPPSLDMHKSNSTTEGLIFDNIFEALITEDSDGNLIPGAAESWDHNEDYTIWTFHLRKDAKWSNGEPVTAKDFVYAWQRLADPNTGSPASTTILQANLINANDVVNGKKPVTELGVKALDDYTLEVNLASPVPYFDKIASMTRLAPLYQPAIDKYGIKWTQPENIVVNGAFTLSSWRPKEKLTLVPNPYYWDKDQVVVKTVEILPITNENTAYNLYRSGAVDMPVSIPLSLYTKDSPQFIKTGELHAFKKACSQYLAINTKNPKLQDVRVRAALKLAVDRYIIAHKLLKPNKDEAYTFSPDRLIGFHPPKPDWFNLTQDERNKQAKELLTAAGYTAKNPLSLTLSYNTSDAIKELMVVILSSYRKAFGNAVNIKLENEEWKTYLQKMERRDFEIARMAGCASLNDASDFLVDMAASNPNNRSGYINPEIDRLLNESLYAKTEEERNQLYYKIEEIIDKNSVFIPLYYSTDAILIKPYIHGHIGDNPLRTYRFKDFYVVKH